MATLETTVTNKDFQNWVTGSLALLFAKQGLDAFVMDDMTQFQKDILASISSRIPATGACSSCTTANVLPCPTLHFCPRSKCGMHDTGQPDKQPSRSCPQNTCNDIREHICRQHIYKTPSWKNTKATKWSTDAFEIAKCYMPPDGYLRISTLSDTDFNGTLAVIINNKRFNNKTTVRHKDVRIEARQVGRDIRHSADLKVTDIKLVKYIDTLVDLLSDTKYLVTDRKAQEAVDKIKQLKSNKLSVTTADIIKALDRSIAAKQQEALEAVELEKEGALGTIEEKTKDASIQLLHEFRTYVADLQTLTVSSLDQIFKARQSSLDEIKEEGEKQKGEVANAGARETEKLEKYMTIYSRKQMSGQQGQIFEAKQSSIDEIKAAGEIQKEEVAEAGAREIEKLEKSQIEAKQSSINEVKAAGETQKLEVAQAGAREIEKLEKSQIEAKQSSINEVKAAGETQKQEVAEAGAREIEKLEKSQIEAERSSIDKIKEEGEKQKQEVAEAGARETEKLEKSMKDDLINFYRNYYSTIPVSPLVEEHDVPLNDFYVKPLLTSLDVRRKFGHCQEKKSIDSYKKLFFRSGDEMYKNIYITAKAGVGKTSFAKSICMTWCQAYRPSIKDKRIFNQEDIDVMKTFEFLFMISLRAIDNSVCDVDTMIERTLLTSLAGRSRYSRRVLEDVLNNRPCLVLLDGLDEWSHPTRCDRGCDDVHSTPPHTAARNQCTMMTTTRPWKFEALKLGRCEIDAHVDIGELDEKLSKQLISNAVSILNSESTLDQPKTVDGFETVTTPLKLGNIRYIPYILMQMICLWFDGKAIGRSICEIYRNIISLTITRALPKLKKDSLPRRNLTKTDEIPSSLQSDDVWNSNYYILIGLGELAFKRLFSSKRESNLVFQRSDVLDFISEESLMFCFKTGLLTNEKVYGAISEKRNNLSFHHKSIQEYLAALYIKSCLDKPETENLIREVCVSLPDVLEMSNVCICLAGFSPDACMKMFHIFENTLVKDKTIEYFRNNLITGQAFIPKFQEYWAIMKSFQGLKIDIVQEIFNSGQRNIPVYIEDIIVDKTICETECKILMKVMANNKEKVKSLSISECRTTEEFTGKLKTLDMRDIRSLHKLMIDAVPHDQDLQQLLSGSVNTLTCLYLAFTIFNEQSEYSITQMSSATVKILSRMNNLQKIALEYINLKHPDIHLLFQYLSAKTTLTDIGLCNIECIDHDEKCNGESLDLSKNQELTELEIDRIPVSTFRVSLSSLEVCIIGKLQTDILSSFLPSLQEANRLRTLSFDSIPEKYTHMITETLEKIPKLETLSFQQCFRVDNVYLPPVMTSLEFVHLCDVYMTGCALEKLLESIDVLPQEVKMTLEAIVVIRKDENFAIPEDESNIVILAEEYLHIKEKIRSSSKYHVICDGQNNTGEDLFSFRTCK